MHRHLIAGALLLTSACAGPAVQTAPTPQAPEPTLRRVADPGPDGLRSVALDPVAVHAVTGPSSITALDFKVGAVYASKGRGAARSHNLGLVIEVTSDSTRPSFRSDRRLLIEIDGRVFLSPPPNPRLYSVREEEQGQTEIIMVPVTLDLLERFVDGDVVRARLGRWTTMEFSKEERGRFAELLGEIPADATFGPQKKAEKVRGPRSVIGG